MEESYFKYSIENIIKKRSSIRTYTPEYLPETIIAELKEYSKSLNGPFNSKLRFEFITNDSFKDTTGGRIGTYGVIKGAQNFIVLLIKDSDNRSLLDAGYVFEQLILFATSLDLGTCWLGGTFRKKGLDKATNMQSDEMIPVISPVGYPEKNKSLVDRVMKAASSSKKRKPWNELFFDNTIDNPLDEIGAKDYATPLEMVRLAPSASNIQPWRIIKDNGYWHFFMESSPIVNKALGFEIQRIDMGIAMCHFELTAKEKELEGNWLINEKPPQIGNDKLQYIATWECS